MQRFARTFIAVLIAVSWAAMPIRAHAWTDDAPTPPKLRLPSDVATPVWYRAELTVIPDQDTFTGTIEIDLQFAKSTRVLWLNANELTVKKATLSAGSEKLEAEVIAEPKDFVGFAFAHPVGPGKATLRVSYEGRISRKDTRGIFQVKDGDQWYVYTQFEEIAARQAFPCFDEPGYKTPWQLTLHVTKEHRALSNTPVLAETVANDGMKTVKFVETRPLPSYLVAFSVGDFEIVDAGTTGKKNIPVHIAVPRGRSAEAVYAAKTTPEIVRLLENYFGIPYPYEKLDEVAVPLFGGAMENAGQVTYGITIILARPENETPQWRRSWVWVAAHELAHQWSGDLVTNAWWDDIWLNEGFANFIADKIVSEYHPEWGTNVGVVNSTQEAMVNDGLVSARSVRQTIESTDDIANAFDQITYDKGDALLSMYESYMGPERFRDGVRKYFAEYAWKNATSADFLAAIASDNPAIASSFSTFLDQPGVPLISVRLDCSKQAVNVDLAQQRLRPLGSAGGQSQLWKVPVCLRYPAGAGDERECVLLDKPARQITLIKATSCPAWIVANADATGYYRVLYQGDLLNKLLAGDARVLNAREQVALIGDIAALTGNGTLALGTSMAQMPNLARNSNRRVIVKTMDISTDPKGNLVSPDFLPKDRLYLEDLYGVRARQLGWKAKPGEREDNSLLRPVIVDVVANQAQDAELVSQAKSLALAWFDDRKAVTPDMVPTLLNTAAQHGDQALFDRLRAAARQEKDEKVQESMLRAMGWFPQPEITQAALAIVLSNEFDIRQSIVILGAAGNSPKNRELAYNFVKQNWEPLIAKLPTDWGSFMPYVVSSFCDEQHRNDAAAFFEGRSTKYTGGPRYLTQKLEGVDLCVAYKKAQQPSLVQFLEKYEEPH